MRNPRKNEVVLQKLRYYSWARNCVHKNHIFDNGTQSSASRMAAKYMAKICVKMNLGWKAVIKNYISRDSSKYKRFRTFIRSKTLARVWQPKVIVNKWNVCSSQRERWNGKRQQQNKPSQVKWSVAAPHVRKLFFNWEHGDETMKGTYIGPKIYSNQKPMLLRACWVRTVWYRERNE